MGLDDVAIPKGGVLQRSFLCDLFHVDEAEARFVSFGPLEIPRQRPLKIPAQGDAFAGGTFECALITVKEINAGIIVDATVQSDEVEAAKTVSSHHDREFTCAMGSEKGAAPNRGETLMSIIFL